LAKRTWIEFPFPDKAYQYTAASLKKNWGRLHKGDHEVFPEEKDLVQAWIHYHAGAFGKAVEIGLHFGHYGYNVANRAQNIHTNTLDEDEASKLKSFQEVIGRCEELIGAQPENVNNFYNHAYALGRYSQCISVVKALAQGLGGKIKASLARAVELDPLHADAHVALGTYHIEVIDKVGSFLGGLTYGASEKKGLEHYRKGLEIFPESPVYKIELANGLVMLQGKSKFKEAEKLYREAAQHTPVDAMERLDVEQAKAELED
jgi:tetratricopeptide (TPR) repeat protein